MNTKKKLRGFTLLELIVVIAIISVLLMIAVPNMISWYRSSKMQDVNAKAQQIYLATQDYLNSLQTRGIDPEEYFGTAGTDGVSYIGVEYFAGKGHKCTSGSDGQEICKSDIYDMTGGITAIAGDAEASCKPLMAVRGIASRLSSDFEGAWLVAIYPKTYTVRYVVFSEEPNVCKKHVNNKYNYDAVLAIGKPGDSHLYASFFASGTAATGKQSVCGNEMSYANSQSYTYDRNYNTRYTGQYPIPVS